MEKLLKQLKEAEESLKIIQDVIKESLTDKSIPLEERWRIFTEHEIGDHDTMYASFESVDLDDFWGDGMINKYETVSIDRIDEWVEENRPLHQEAFREEAIKAGYISYDFDW